MSSHYIHLYHWYKNIFESLDHRALVNYDDEIYVSSQLAMRVGEKHTLTFFNHNWRLRHILTLSHLLCGFIATPERSISQVGRRCPKVRALKINSKIISRLPQLWEFAPLTILRGSIRRVAHQCPHLLLGRKAMDQFNMFWCTCMSINLKLHLRLWGYVLARTNEASHRSRIRSRWSRQCLSFLAVGQWRWYSGSKS